MTPTLSDASVLPSPALSRHKILYIDHTAKLGGGELALLQMVRYLDQARFVPVVVLFMEGPLAERLREAGIETHILAISSDVAETRKDSLGVKSLLKFREVGAAFAHIRRLAKFIREQRPALVHTNSLKSDIIGGIAGRMARVPVLWHVRDRIVPEYLPGPVVKVFRLLCRWIPQMVVANSESTLETLALPPGKPAAIVYSGVEMSAEVAAVERAEIDGPPVIGLVGRISPWKGQHIFLQAAAKVREKFPAAKFQIVGSVLFDEKEYEAEIHALTRTLNLENSVEYTGFRNDVPALIAAMTVLVHASTVPEPFGQVVVQGMAAGKPVVATRGGGVTETMIDGETGWLVPMEDPDALAAAILRLLENPEQARKMGEAGRERVFQFYTIDATAAKVAAVYESVLKNI